MIRLFFIISAVVFASFGALSFFWEPALWTFALWIPIFLVGVNDLSQKRQAVRRNFPVIGNLRYFFEMIRPELQQYFVESNLSGSPLNRELRSIVYQRAKGQMQTLPFGTQQNVYSDKYEWVNHSIVPKKVNESNLRVKVGGPQCKKPYMASIFNISAMSYGSLSHAAVTALNLGAAKGGFSHNTGEGGLSPFHLQGADVVWNIGTGYFSCRTLDGKFSPQMFKEKAAHPNVKMIELKLSQGAKPGKGGMLPKAKVSAEIAEIRGVKIGEDVLSPAYHTAFTTPMEMMAFIQHMRELSGGKPVGFKLCVGKKFEFMAICKAILKTGIYPDFITVDGGEGGTGAAPLEFSNAVGMPLEEGLTFIHDTLVGFGLREHIRIFASGKVITGVDMISRMALGADALNSARGMMLSLGCIQALKCNTNHCPVGITTNNPQLVRGLHVPSKIDRVYNYHKETVHSFAEILGAMGYELPSQIRRSDVNRRISASSVMTYEDLFPSVDKGALLKETKRRSLRPDYIEAYELSSADSFLANDQHKRRAA